MKKSTIAIISSIIGVILAISIIGGVVVYLNTRPRIETFTQEAQEALHQGPHKITYINPYTGAVATYAVDETGNKFYESIDPVKKSHVKEVDLATKDNTYFYYHDDLETLELGSWEENLGSLDYNVFDTYTDKLLWFDISVRGEKKIKKIKSLSLDEATSEIVMDTISDYDYVLYSVTCESEGAQYTVECAIEKETNMTLFFKSTCVYSDGTEKVDCTLLKSIERENHENYSYQVNHLVKD
ncbi:MAG: hypothetical protein IJD42_07680 [Clostridia bacterium]|nr:hypothetical protein [Clostridia bacterium]